MSCPLETSAGPVPVTTSSKATSSVWNGVLTETVGLSPMSPDTLTRSVTAESVVAGRGQAWDGAGIAQPASPTAVSPRTAKTAGILRTGTV